MSQCPPCPAPSRSTNTYVQRQPKGPIMLGPCSVSVPCDLSPSGFAQISVYAHRDWWDRKRPNPEKSFRVTGCYRLWLV